MRRVIVGGFVFVALLGLGAAGCFFSPDRAHDDPPAPPPGPPWPDTPDQLIANFKAAYDSMALGDYGAALHPQYQFILQAADVLPGEADRFTRAEELQVATNMFSGHPVEKPDGTTAPGISAIVLAVLTRSTPWTDMGAAAPDFPLTKRALYDIQISFARAGYNTIIVIGQQEFFVSVRDSLVHGVVKPYCQLRGQRDLSYGNKNEMNTWSRVKNLYR
jgi:hypothetical protein